MGKFVGVGKCVFIGESLFMIVFIYIGKGKVYVVFVVLYLGIILFIDLIIVGG